MTVSIEGPALIVKFSDIVNLVKCVSESYVRNIAPSDYIDLKVHDWSLDEIVDSDGLDRLAVGNISERDANLIPSRKDVVKSCLDRGISLAQTVHLKFGNNQYNFDNKIRTRIINEGVLKDIISGQFLPSPKARFSVHSTRDRGYESYFDKFLEDRNAALKDCQDRINAVIGVVI